MKRVLIILSSAVIAFGLFSFGVNRSAGEANAPSLPSVERLRPAGFMGAMRRQRQGGLLVDLRPAGKGRQIASAIHARPHELPALIERHFKNYKGKGRRFVVVIGDEQAVAKADNILSERTGFDVLRYLPAWFLERHTPTFLNTGLPLLTVTALPDIQRGGKKPALIDIQLEDEQHEVCIPGSRHISPYNDLHKKKFVGLPLKDRPVAVY